MKLLFLHTENKPESSLPHLCFHICTNYSNFVHIILTFKICLRSALQYEFKGIILIGHTVGDDKLVMTTNWWVSVSNAVIPK